MKFRKDIDTIRAEEIAKLFLLKSPLHLTVERIGGGDSDADFWVHLPGSPVKIAVQVKQSKNLKRDLLKVANAIQKADFTKAEILPILLIVVHPHEIAAEIAVLANWGEQGMLELNKNVSLTKYSIDALDNLILDVIQRYETSHSIAS